MMTKTIIERKRAVSMALSMVLIAATPSVIQANSHYSINSYKVLGAVAATAAVSGIYAVSRWYRNATRTNNTSNNNAPKNAHNIPKNVSFEYLDINNDADVQEVMVIVRENQKDQERYAEIEKYIKNASTVVAKADGAIIGMVTYALESGQMPEGIRFLWEALSTDSWIVFVGIKQAYQSKRYGTVLLQKVMHELKCSKKVNRVGIYVDSQNYRAQKLYERNGLKVVGTMEREQETPESSSYEIRACNITWRGYFGRLGVRLGILFGIL